VCSRVFRDNSKTMDMRFVALQKPIHVTAVRVRTEGRATILDQMVTSALVRSRIAETIAKRVDVGFSLNAYFLRKMISLNYTCQLFV